MRNAGPERSGWRSGWARAAAAQLFALGLVAAATAVRVMLGAQFPDLIPFSLYFPAVLVAALAGGWPAAATALVASALSGWWFFIRPHGPALDHPSTALNLALYLAAAASVAVAGVYVRRLVERLRAGNAALTDSEARFRTLFDSVSEGFALMEVVRDPSGRVTDYIVRDTNPAMLRALGQPVDLVGRRQSELMPNVPAAYLSACHRALTGEPVSFEWQSSRSKRWYEVRLARVTDSQLAQVVVDITDRKTADARQSELFDELNHRMKNNLAMVSSMLALQARSTEDTQVKGQLMKAVDRIQAIADVHASLYRGSRKDDVDFASYLNDLCERLSGSLLDGDRLRIELSAEPAVMPLDRAVALGVVVNELVTNAAKHAYPAPTQGVIRVALEHAGPGMTLSVGDSGQGLAVEPSNAGLGMRLVRSLVQQIGATLEIERHPGATFRVNLPDAAPPPAAAAGAGGQAHLF